ncbi:hypothetical protein [Myxococcus sp. RHSTA-1-4]|uniref:hypothetical protein n=1 Tax=Myxococcus sp. RHSTA-1-4 TaxID=2874601 RepID=UPI001CBB19B8|nr:hypothetical protein [Myxococcus sp. RHSTA-1-4]MBZ4417553.1 hypothetical protein [Myxococcus sp. RHSTA-1-4]
MSSSAGPGKLVFDLIEAAKPQGPWGQLLVGFFAVGFVATFLVVRHKHHRDRSH